MSNALRIARGRFGRVALLDMDRPLVWHAHPHCHVLLKVEGANTQFSVRDRLVPLTDESAVLINAWEPHAYAHDQTRAKTVILALYIEPQWLGHFRPNWAASHAPDFFASNVGLITPGIRSRTRTLAEAMVQEPNSSKAHETLLGELMTALIERFAEWRAVPNSIRDLASRSVPDFRIRNAVERMKASPGEITDLDRLAIDVGLSRAFLPTVRNVDRGDPARLPQCAATRTGCRGRRRREGQLRHDQRPARLFCPGAFFALFSRSCRILTEHLP
ncbi:hypothetical protein J2046_004677 [Rhizobium petrolearium]|nr:hypothetical protein [Neorhizobium petrolearium]